MFARSSLLPRRTLAAGAAALMAISLGSLTADSASAVPARQAPGPIHAGNTFGWYGHGGLVYDETFVGPLNHRRWHVEGPGAVRTQHGMLTLNTAKAGSVSATLRGTGHRTGRWEIRLRSRQYSRSHAAYEVRTELVPAAARPQNCGARNIALNSYKLGGNRAHHYIRSLPNRQYSTHTGVNLGTDRWHTFAVELTGRRISWFVDAHVVSTERRPEAMSRLPYTVQFTMVAEPGKRMNRSRMQMDWLRYFTLRKPNSRSVEAPLPSTATYAEAC